MWHLGLKMRKTPRRESAERVDEVLKLVRLEAMGNRRPDQLSGGQQQRVALARALVNRPEVLLLDEPLAALDLKLRQAMREELKRIQKQVGITFIFVTHDQEEALTMSDRIAVMNDGVALQVGKPYDIYEDPTSRFVADFIGETNFIDGVLTGVVETKYQVQLDNGEQTLVDCDVVQAEPGARVTIAIRPEKIFLGGGNAPKDVENAYTGVVEEIHLHRHGYLLSYQARGCCSHCGTTAKSGLYWYRGNVGRGRFRLRRLACPQCKSVDGIGCVSDDKHYANRYANIATYIKRSFGIGSTSSGPASDLS